MDKQTLRERYLSIRDKAHADHAAEPVEGQVAAQLAKIPHFSRARTILLYASTRSEVPTDGLIKRMLSEGKTVALPRVLDKRKRTMGLGRLTDLRQLHPAEYGVREPPAGKAGVVKPLDVEVAIMPGIAFDPAGYRLGYGGGFYDRFLPRLGCPFVGLAYDEQVAPLLPHEAHDIPMDFIVTPTRTIMARANR